jgi:16S rRNA (cytosine1402-N4)-methyltransferase
MHISVLLSEAIEGLSLKPDDVVLDATAGAGGHSEAICRKLGSEGMLIALDADMGAVLRVRERLSSLSPLCRYEVSNANFRDLARALGEVVVRNITKALFDLGLSSDQLESSSRGFSFRADEPLLMTFRADESPETLTARAIVNEWDEQSISDILWYYGEERFARRIAEEIVKERRIRPFETTGDLVEVIERVVPHKRTHLHPATKTFQALRITVNDEIGALREGLEAAYERLAPKGRLAVISFHSIEDRVVKRFMKARVKEDGAILITKKPIIPGAAELGENPRARSAKLRILERS